MKTRRKAKTVNKKLQVIRVHMGLFDYTVVFVVGDPLRAERLIRKRLEDDDVSIVGSSAYGLTFIRNGYCPFIWLPKKPTTHRELATLGHESNHAALQLLRWAGVTVTKESEEVLTHAQTYLFRQLLARAK